MEDFIRVETNKNSANGYSVYGFDDGEGAPTRTGGVKKKMGQAIGRNMAGKGTKIHVIMAEKHVVRGQVSGLNRHNSQMTYQMMNGLNLKIIKHFVSDTRYDDGKFIWKLKVKNIRAEIPPRRNRKEGRGCDKTVYAWRRRIGGWRDAS
jgi:hypothetical protein